MTADAVGGVWEYAIELARGLSHAGTAVTLATMGPRPSSDRRAQAAAVPGLDLVESDFALEWMPEPWRDVDRAGAWLLDLEATTEPDIVHVNGYAHAALPFKAPRVLVAHSCVCSWWWAVREQDAPGEWAPYRRAVRRGLDAADAVVAPTAAMWRALAAHHGPVAGAVIPNGHDTAHSTVVAKEPYVLSAGRLWDDAKNVRALADAGRELSWPVVVAGDTAAPSGGVLSLEGVTCLGRLPARDLHDLMARASIYALPAVYEPFGLSVLEAASARCALVLGDIPSLREVWDGAAAFAPPRDPAILARTIENLIADPGRRDELGRRAAARAREFGASRMAAAYLRLYGWLLGGNRMGQEVSACAS